MRPTLVIALVAACLLAADAPDKAKQERAEKRNYDRWQGKFEAVSIVNNGEIASPQERAKRKLTVTGTEYHFQNGNFSEHGTYKFDVTQNPRHLDIKVGDGKDKGKVYKAIYDIDDQRVEICFENENKKRPIAFGAAPGSGCTSEVWKKLKP